MGRKTMLVHTGTPSVLILFAVLCLYLLHLGF